MKSIEERARELAVNCEASKDAFGCGFRKGVEDGYIHGATKQKAIDIDKACEWFDRCAKSYVMDLTQEENLPAGCDTLVGFCLVDFVRDFRKAME